MIIHSLALPRTRASQYDARIDGVAKGAQIHKSTFIKHSTLLVMHIYDHAHIWSNLVLFITIFLAKTLTLTLIKTWICSNYVYSWT